jgi:hypothetical protein
LSQASNGRGKEDGREIAGDTPDAAGVDFMKIL